MKKEKHAGLFFREEVGEDAVGGAYVVGYVAAGGFAGGGAEGCVGEQAVEGGGSGGGVGDAECSAEGDEVARFLEFVVVGAEYDGNAVDGGFVDVVYAGSVSAADVDHGCVAVERREFAEAVDHYAAHAGGSGAVVGDMLFPLRQGDYVAADGIAQRADAGCVKFVGRDDEFYCRIGVEPGQVVGLVGFPAAAEYDEGAESVASGYLACACHDVGDAVEACVAGHDSVVDAYPGEELTRIFVLEIDAVETAQHLAEHASVGAEEYLPGPEYGRYDINGYPRFGELLEVVAPEFIFYEDCHRGAYGLDEATGVARRVKRQVGHRVDKRIVLAHFVARGGEEREQYLPVGVLAPQTFDEGASLLELAERRSVYPYRATFGGKGGLQTGESLLMALDHLFSLRIGQRYYPDRRLVEMYA